MYATLVFPSSTLSGGIVRDIVRLISDSNSGTASLANLEYVDASASTFTAGVNSGWSVHSSTPLPSSGTALSTSDGAYTLESPCVDTSKNKYVSIGINAATSRYSQNSVPVSMVDIIDAGEATELLMARYTSTTSSYWRNWGIGDNTVRQYRIHATPRKLIIYGKNPARNTNMIFMKLESPDTGSTAYHGLKPSCLIVDQDRAATSSYTGAIYATSTNIARENDSLLTTFAQTFYDTDGSAVVRYAGLQPTTGQGYWAYYHGASENGTTLGAAQSSVSQIYRNFTSQETTFSSPQSMYAGNSGLYFIGPSVRGGQSQTSSGQITLPLYSLIFDATQFANGVFNFSSLSKVYMAPTIGQTSDEVVVGTKTYEVFRPYSSEGSGGVYLIEKE